MFFVSELLVATEG